MAEPGDDKSRSEDSRAQEPSASSDDLASLRGLLVGPEQDQLRALQYRLDDPKSRAREISHILPEAIAIRGHDEALTKALALSVEKAINTSVRRNPKPLADALFPVMGPAIRKAITHALNGMFESFNKVLEQGLSWKSLHWRVEAWRTGRSFSEVVLLHTLLYRVEQVFLIQRSSGLLLLHVSARSSVVQDADMVSGMLTAIRDFVRDSFGAADQDSLEELQVGELSVWIEQGPQAILAAVIRGNPPGELRASLQDALESIHLQYPEELESLSGDTAVFEPARPVLEACVQTQYRDTAKSSSLRTAWIFAAIIVLTLSVWGFFHIRDQIRWNRYLSRLRSEPGIVVISTGSEGGRHVVSGLRDPLSADPGSFIAGYGLSQEEVSARWDLYQAFDPRLILRRAYQILAPPASVTLSFEDGVLKASGSASWQWIGECHRLARLVPGVARFQDRELQDKDLNALIDEFDRANLRFVTGTSQLVPGQQQVVSALLAGLSRLNDIARNGGNPIRLQIIGHTDSDGNPESNVELSNSRAKTILSLLQAQNFESLEVVTEGVGSDQPLTSGTTEQDKQKNRRVSFKVSQPK